MTKKNQKYRKQKPKKNFPWLFVVLGGGLLLLAAVLFANRSGGDGSGTPSIAMDQQLIDYGDVKFGVEKSFTIKVTNTGDGTLRFKEAPYIEVVEGC
jgi:hypothetical protein